MAMNFDEYQKDGKQLYEDFAKLIRNILAEAIKKDSRALPGNSVTPEKSAQSFVNPEGLSISALRRLTIP
jgi:hypothetical protein